LSGQSQAKALLQALKRYSLAVIFH